MWPRLAENASFIMGAQMNGEWLHTDSKRRK